MSKAWDVEVSGNPWYVVTTKLKKVKVAMRNLNRVSGNLTVQVNEARNALNNYQGSMPLALSRDQLLEEERLIQQFRHALKLEEIFLKQKLRVQWLKCGDANNKFFYSACKNRWKNNKILALEDEEGTTHTSHSAISEVAVNYFTHLLGQDTPVNDIPDDLELPQLSSDFSDYLIRPFTNLDVFNALKSMPNNKCPGPDGFTKEFFIST